LTIGQYVDINLLAKTASRRPRDVRQAALKDKVAERTSRRKTMPYIEAFVLPVPKKNLAAYQKLARKTAKIFKKHGALEVYEYVGDDLDMKYGIPFPKLAKVKKGETVIFSWMVFKSKAHRDKVNKEFFNDPVMSGMDMSKLPFDIKRMSMGGFKLLVAG